MECPSWYFTKALSHRQKVLRLYKRALKEVDAWYLPDTLEVRYHKVLLRSRFEKNKDEKDPRVAKRMLLDGVKEYWEKMHPYPLHFAGDPQGVAYERVGFNPTQDYILDEWHPYEKMLFPKYFAKREQLKEELMKHDWDKIVDQKEEKVRKDTGLD